MKKTIVVIDGMGGGIGVQLIGKLKGSGVSAEIIALGANSTATERMLKAGADRGATGENAIRVSVGLGDFILGPIGIVIMNSLMGEISPEIAGAVLAARGERILIPLQNDHICFAGLQHVTLAKMIEDCIEIIRAKCR